MTPPEWLVTESRLSEHMREQLLEIIRHKHLPKHLALQSGVVNYLVRLDDDQAERVFSRFAECNIERIRNPTGALECGGFH